MTMEPKPRKSRKGILLAIIAVVAIGWGVGIFWMVTRDAKGPSTATRPPYVVLPADDTPPFIKQKCSACHPLSHPTMLSKEDWPRIINHMADMSKEKFNS